MKKIKKLAKIIRILVEISHLVIELWEVLWEKEIPEEDDDEEGEE